MLLNKNRVYVDEIVAKGKLLPNIKEIFQMGITFFIVCIAWVFFRSPNVSYAFNYLEKIFSKSFFSIPDVSKTTLVLIIVLLIFEWLQREKQHALQLSKKFNPFFRIALYYLVLLAIILFNAKQQTFIYFQF